MDEVSVKKVGYQVFRLPAVGLEVFLVTDVGSTGGSGAALPLAG